MAKRGAARRRQFGASFKPVSLTGRLNWPGRSVRGEWWQKLAEAVRGYPEGAQTPWGIPFEMAGGTRDRAVLVRKGEEATVPLRGKANYVCLLHEWRQLPEQVHYENPTEGLVVAEYELTYSDGSSHVQPMRARFEVCMVESPGPAWLALPFHMWQGIDPVKHPAEVAWGRAQPGLQNTYGVPLVYAMPNPRPDANLRSLTIRGLLASPLLVAGLTLCRSSSHPLRHLPRRSYRVAVPGGPAAVESAQVDLGGVARIEKTRGPRGGKWLSGPQAGLHHGADPDAGAESLVEAFGAEDATLSVKLAGEQRERAFSLGSAFHRGQDPSGRAKLQVLGRERQWMTVRVVDSSTGKPTPTRIHITGSRGEYIAPYGHHAQVNAQWFEDYGADVVSGGRQYAYVQGTFTTELPVGDLYIEICKGFEYQPVRTKVTIRPGQKELTLKIGRTLDWRSTNWVTADTHVHFVSPHTAWLEGQAEGVNVVNLLASQWGRLFTNMGDYIGGANVVGEDTIVYVGTENRNHMLGHMSMLGTKGLPVFPMCCGGPSESFVGDPDFRTLAEWAQENRRKGGVVIRPHFPFCGDTEDPVPILKGLVDALEIRGGEGPGGDFPTQEWYRYLNTGYRVAVVGGTDKMGAYCPIGWMRTYALLEPGRPLTYANWAKAVRAGRTFSTSGPLIDMTVDGCAVGDTIRMGDRGGTVEVEARAESVWPLGRIEIVQNGRAVAAESARGSGAPKLRAKAKVRLSRSGWIAARCSGPQGRPAGYTGAHTSPVYVQVGETRAFDGPAAQHMLALVEGGMEYLNTLATVYDEPSRKRMVKLFKEARAELKGRLVVEAGHQH